MPPPSLLLPSDVLTGSHGFTVYSPHSMFASVSFARTVFHLELN